ncbi:hypothetical protein PK28_01930 [Hymenobacter sp. DG25B]|nr:hypothetical protein PK28_01930 [Hymenobacter sp. DG25B]
MRNYITDTFYKSVIKCLIFELTVNSRTCNTQLFHYTGNGNTAVFNGFLQDFALVWHIDRVYYWGNVKM